MITWDELVKWGACVTKPENRAYTWCREYMEQDRTLLEILQVRFPWSSHMFNWNKYWLIRQKGVLTSKQMKKLLHKLHERTDYSFDDFDIKIKDKGNYPFMIFTFVNKDTLIKTVTPLIVVNETIKILLNEKELK